MLHVYSTTRDIYSIVTTRQSNPPISKCSRPCNQFTSVWSMFQCIFAPLRSNTSQKTKYVLFTYSKCLLVPTRLLKSLRKKRHANTIQI